MRLGKEMGSKVPVKLLKDRSRWRKAEHEEREDGKEEERALAARLRVTRRGKQEGGIVRGPSR